LTRMNGLRKGGGAEFMNSHGDLIQNEFVYIEADIGM